MEKTSTGAALLLSLFLVSLFIPTNIDLGGLRLTSYRLILLVTLFPTAFKVFAGRAGGVNATEMPPMRRVAYFETGVAPDGVELRGHSGIDVGGTGSATVLITAASDSWLESTTVRRSRQESRVYAAIYN